MPDRLDGRQMPTFRLYRPRALDLVFEGERLADVSTRANEHQTRWTETRIYRTDSGKYVTESVGRSIEPGEEDRFDVRVLTDPHGILKAFRRRRRAGNWFFPKNVLDAFEQAVASDPSLSAILGQR
jgi:hypothetical protein